MGNRGTGIAAAALATALLAAPAAADTVYLKNGRVIYTEVRKIDDEGLHCVTGYGKYIVRRDQVASLERNDLHTRHKEELPPVPEPAAEPPAASAEPAPPAPDRGPEPPKPEPPVSASAPPAPSAAPWASDAEVTLKLVTGELKVPPAVRKQVDETVAAFDLGVLPPDQAADGLVLAGAAALPYLLDRIEHDIPLFGREGHRPRAFLVIAAGRIDNPKALSPLTRILRSAPGIYAVSAVAALEALGNADAIPPLIASLDSPENNVAELARKAIQALASSHPDYGIESALDEGLSGSGPHRKAHIANLISALHLKKAFHLLARILEDGTDWVQIAAIKSMQQVGNGRAVPYLLPYVENPEDLRGRTAVLALGTLKAWEAVPFLVEALKSQEAGLVTDAHWALQKITGSSLGPDPELWAQWWETEKDRPHPNSEIQAEEEERREAQSAEEPQPVEEAPQ